MKKTLFILGIVMSLFTTKVSAQEVRGIETRRAIYKGEEYVLKYERSYYNNDAYEFGRSDEYYGFEFTNKNSIPVSVSIEIFEKGTDKLIHTKEIVLNSQESYICKYLEIQRYYSLYTGNRPGPTIWASDSDSEKWKKAASKGEAYADQYYVKYKAYKLL